MRRISILTFSFLISNFYPYFTIPAKNSLYCIPINLDYGRKEKKHGFQTIRSLFARKIYRWDDYWYCDHGPWYHINDRRQKQRPQYF